MSPVLSGFLAAAPPPGAQPQPLWWTFGPVVLVFVIFYFLLIAPARKKQKRHQEMLNDLKPGDRVITQGGIHGTISGVSDAVVQLKIADQVKVEVDKRSITDKVQ
ncbi:MAG: preprotein translocase subunit YajC [Acidobacteriia bacterium]|nr:preprotein translocase subunit YajC [Terriglobia bacterium]